MGSDVATQQRHEGVPSPMRFAQPKRLRRDRRMLRRLGHAETLGNDHHIGSRLANLECLFEQRGVEGSLEIEAKERFRQCLAHVVEKLIEDLTELGIQAFTELLLRIS